MVGWIAIILTSSPGGGWYSYWCFPLSHWSIHFGSFLHIFQHSLHLPLSSLICKPTLHPNLLYIAHMTCFRYFFIALSFVKPLLSSSCVCISLTYQLWVVYSLGPPLLACGPGLNIPCLSSMLCAVSLHLKASAIMPRLYSSTSLSWTHKYFTLHRRNSCYYCLYKAIFILYKEKKNKLGINTWSLKALLLQIKPVKAPGRSSKFQVWQASVFRPCKLSTEFVVCY